MRRDEDSEWKEIINNYFERFILFFFPHIYRDINWSHRYRFLDKELEKLIKENSVGKRFVDKLVEVYLKDDRATWLLIHIEVQGGKEPDFAKRMYVYNYRIFDRYEQEVISLAILTDPDQKYRPNRWKSERWGFENFFKFPLIKIIDYEKDWGQLEKDDNPFSIVVMAQIKAVKLKNPDDLFSWKMHFIRMLYNRGYQRREILNLFRFIDWIMILPDELEKKLIKEVCDYEEEIKMPYVTSAERFGIEKGCSKGCKIP